MARTIVDAVSAAGPVSQTNAKILRFLDKVLVSNQVPGADSYGIV